MQSFELSLDNWPIQGSSFRIFVCHYVCDMFSAAPRGIFAILRDIVPKLQKPRVTRSEPEMLRVVYQQLQDWPFPIEGEWVAKLLID